jgi:hypothetical protein
MHGHAQRTDWSGGRGSSTGVIDGGLAYDDKMFSSSLSDFENGTDRHRDCWLFGLFRKVERAKSDLLGSPLVNALPEIIPPA